MNTWLLELLAIIVLILANGFFAASEFALIAARKSRIKNWARKGNRSAARTRKLMQQPDRFLATIQVGVTFVGTLAGVFGGATLVENLASHLQRSSIEFVRTTAHPIAIVMVVVFISILSVILGELVPKYIALMNPEKTALRITRPIWIFSRATFFLVSFFTWAARGLLKILGLSNIPERAHISDEEINILISEGIEKGAFDPTEQRLIKSVFDFTDTTVRQAMTPRVDIVGIPLGLTPGEAAKIMAQHGYSRYPIYKDSLDQITGMIYAKDLMAPLAAGNKIDLGTITRQPLFVPDSMPLSVLLGTFQKRRVHVAVVLDEYGGTAGMITMEDILEEIVGDIQDEHDQDQAEFVKHSETIAFAAGALRPDELNEQFGVNLPEKVSDTVAGLIVEMLGRVPERKETIMVEGVMFTILEMSGNRILRVRVEKKPDTVAGEDHYLKDRRWQ
jgi:putative hemolysin